MKAFRALCGEEEEFIGFIGSARYGHDSCAGTCRRIAILPCTRVSSPNPLFEECHFLGTSGLEGSLKKIPQCASDVLRYDIIKYLMICRWIRPSVRCVCDPLSSVLMNIKDLENI